MSATKRRATAAAEEVATPASKRRRVTDDQVETPQTTTDVGLKFIHQLKSSQDKNGRPIIGEFLTLPNKRQYPEYYREIKLPIAIDTVEDKLNRFQYSNLTTLESDLKRMVQNAKNYNDKNSEIYSDAERIRKSLSNFMPRHNPAYKDPNYVAVPTPIPPELENQPNDGPQRHAPLKVTLRNSNGALPSAVSATSNGLDTGFAGDTFQTAQEKIMKRMIDLRNADGEEIAEPFLDKPSRTAYPDYYQLISRPVSLKSIQREVKGLEGKNKKTGVSNFGSWHEFEEVMNLIWQNARTYNEDGTQISELAGELEGYFSALITEAKRAVKEPPQVNGNIRIKLNIGKTPEPVQKLKIKMPGQAASATPSLDSNQSGMAVDSDALRRQQEVVRAGSNGQGLPRPSSSSNHTGPRNPFGGSTPSSTPIPALSSIVQERTRSASAASPVLSASGVKSEGVNGPSPSNAPVDTSKSNHVPTASSPQPDSAPVMQPPSNTTPRPPSETPRPQSGPITNYTPYVPPVAAKSVVDSRFREPGKDASNALISNVNVSTHPGLKVDRRFQMNIPPSPRLTQQSITINLPSDHYYLRIIPTFAPSALSRPHKYIVNLGFQKIKESKDESGQIVYDTRILPGVNKIEVDMIVGVARGVPKVSATGEDLHEFERTTIFAHLMKPTQIK